MFRLPFLATNLNQYYDDPIIKSKTSWSHRANQLRTGLLRRLNQAGEQVNSNNERCDDSDNRLDASSGGELNTPVAYLYYNNIAKGRTGLVAAAVKANPLYLYLTVTTEGSFEGKGDTLSVVQTPANIIGLSYTSDTNEQTSTLLMKPPPVLRRREVVLGMYTKDLLSGTEFFEPSASIPTFANYAVDGGIINKETTGPHANEYYVADANSRKPIVTKIYVRLKYPDEQLNATNTLGVTAFDLEGLQIQKGTASDPGDYYAAYYTKNESKYRFDFDGAGDIQFDNLATKLLDYSGIRALEWM